MISLSSPLELCLLFTVYVWCGVKLLSVGECVRVCLLVFFLHFGVIFGGPKTF